jgi:hypothetical protein
LEAGLYPAQVLFQRAELLSKAGDGFHDTVKGPPRKALWAELFRCFLAADPCPGQLCDEAQDSCLGTVPLQPKSGEPLLGLTASQLSRFASGFLIWTWSR